MLNMTNLSVANYNALLVGWSKQAVQSDVTFGAGSTKYTETAARTQLVNQGWTITDGGPNTQTITFDNMNKTYGDAPFTPTATASSTLPLTFSSSNDAIAFIEKGQVVIAGAGTVTITASQAGSALILPGKSTATLVVSEKPLKISSAVGKSKEYDGNTSAELQSVVWDGLINNDKVSLTCAQLEFADKKVGTRDIAARGCTLSGTDAVKYTLSAQPTTITAAKITPRPITVTADAKSKAAGDNDPQLTQQVTTGSLVIGDTFTGSLERETGESVGTYKIRQGTLANSNYDISYKGAELTITSKLTSILNSAHNPGFQMYATIQDNRLQVQLRNSNAPVLISVVDVQGNVVVSATSTRSIQELPISTPSGNMIYVVARSANGYILGTQKIVVK